MTKTGASWMPCLASPSTTLATAIRLVQAISEQAGQLLHTGNLFRIGPQEQLADQICQHSFGDAVYFCNSGAEAMNRPSS